ncbi:MAG TPA: tetratricopeptide repeat protein [Acidimicrobiia bacterium]|jgi:predicted ATPase/DNA-binding CsgD family transcriptional regulator|nr:tetratricopeptide repeat protein [Acidimicrobiia bacterium]
MDRLDRIGVTARERDVLALVGERLTNREIGERLYISVRTVESHVSSLLRKLEADTRRDLIEMASAAALRGFPVPSTSLVGRESLLDEIVERLSARRLVTLSGAAGAGKTRMAVEAGNRIASRFQNGAVFVDLVPLSDQRFVAATVATSLGIGGTAGSSMPTEDLLVAYLSQRESLLVLDNCEHVLRGAAMLVDRILTDCPDVKVLVTSRQGFATPAESLLMVPPLQLPNGGSKPPAEVESVQLLVERAEGVRPDLGLLAGHTDAVVHICRRLDGLPLAIELAAVQLAHLTPEDVAARLDERFRLLGGRRADAPPKSTLRTALDWSYGLLSEPEAMVFNRLGVFAGSFSLEAAEAVCSDTEVDREQIPGLLGSLVWKSMVLVTPDLERSRFRLLETMREYARERLNQQGDLDETAARHCDWYAGQVDEAAPHLTKPEADVWLRDLDQDLGNLRAALRWTFDSGKAEAASRIMAGLWRYWHMRGGLEEGERWATQILSIAQEPSTRARTLEAAGGLAWWGGDMKQAIDHYEEALTLLRSYGSETDLANALYNASLPYGFADKTETALAYADEAREIFERLGDEEGVAKSNWGWGASAHAARRDAEAVVAYEKALEIYETLDDTFMLGWVHRMLGRSLLALNKLESARPHLDSGIGLFDSAGDISGVILHLRDYADLAMQQQDHERAVVLAGAVRAMEDESGLNLIEGFSEQLEGLDQAREAVGEKRAQELFNHGLDMSRTSAIRYALS